MSGQSTELVSNTRALHTNESQLRDPLPSAADSYVSSNYDASTRTGQKVAHQAVTRKQHINHVILQKSHRILWLLNSFSGFNTSASAASTEAAPDRPDAWRYVRRPSCSCSGGVLAGPSSTHERRSRRRKRRRRVVH